MQESRRKRERRKGQVEMGRRGGRVSSDCQPSEECSRRRRRRRRSSMVQGKTEGGTWQHVKQQDKEEEGQQVNIIYFLNSNMIK